MPDRRVGVAPAADSIARPRLAGVLGQVPPGGVGLLVAPAGAGKSVLLAQWAGVQARAWLSLSEAHNDAFGLARDLASAVLDVHDGFDVSIASLVVSGGPRLGEVFIEALIAELAEAPVPVLLVLDDLHQVSNGQVLEDLGRLLLRLPGNVRALMSSRWDLSLGLGRARLEGALLELRAADLAFEPQEATALLELVSGRHVTPRQAEVLVARTDGWAAGLRLAALSLANVADVDAFIAGFAGDDRLVVDYLSGAVLAGLDERTRSFLLRVSVLEWLSPPLCAAVTGEADARCMLAALVEHGLFLTRTGPSGRYRFHQLFADLLRFQLAARDPGAEVVCRRRAASWLLEHHEYASAVDQLLAAGDYHQAFEVLAIEGHRLFERGEVSTLLRALTRIHDAAPTSEVAIHLLAAQVGADEFTAAAENYRTLSRRADLSPGQRVAIDTLASVIGFSFLPLEEMRTLTVGALALLPEVSSASVPDFAGVGGAESCEVMATFFSSLAAFLGGDLHSSTRGFERTLKLPGLKYPIWRINTLGTFALTRAWQGRLTDAERMALAALDTAQEIDAMDHVAVTCAHLSLAVVYLDRLDVGDAAIHLEAAASGVGRCRRPVYDQLLHVQQVRHLAITDSLEAALTQLRDAAPHGLPRPLIEQALGTLETQLLVRAGSVRQARARLESTRVPGPAAWIDVHVAGGDITRAREILDKWDPPATDLRASLERDLRSAVLTHHEGHPGAAGTQVADAALRAETEGLLTPFLDTPMALSLLRTAAPARALRLTRTRLNTTPAPAARGQRNDQLIEPLTPREVIVLEYLPSRLGNDQIADALYVSVNTLKTHLRNIYRKLEAPGRDAAVQRATSLGLI